MKRIILVLAVLLIGCTPITNFEECAAAGNKILKSYPAKCIANGQTFIQEIEINSFEDCLIWGDAVLESYPRQCKAGDKTFIEDISPLITEEEALEIAKQCENGELTDNIGYNAYTNTWWIDFLPDEPNDLCNPACVVSEEEKTAEVNWRCTGALI